MLSLLHRDLGAHLLLGATPYQLFCQYLANADSPTHAREGNVHHGDAASRRFPMMSHLGKMLSVVVGGTWAARRNGEQVFGLAVIGDGGTSTGEFHESLNIASVHKVPVLFLIENNHYAFSTPTSVQYNCRRLSDRAVGYGISGRTIDGTDPWTVYSAVCEAIDAMEESSLPVLLECDTLRLCGHAAYDKGLYVPAEVMEQWRKDDPLLRTRRCLAEVCGLAESSIAAIEEAVETEVREAVARALAVGAAKAAAAVARTCRGGAVGWRCRRDGISRGGGRVGPVLPALAAAEAAAGQGSQERRRRQHGSRLSPGEPADGIPGRHGRGSLWFCIQDLQRPGRSLRRHRVIDMPLAESSIMGFALGASQTGAEPIIEFQFADFSTEAVTQLGLNAGTWYFRTGCAAPMLMRLPCGGGLTVGAFHSGEFEGLWSRFPGLKLLYPATPQETYEALLAGFYDPNPCLVFEHKLLYWSRSGDIDFDGDLQAVWRPRRYTEGTDLTLVAVGAMVQPSLAAAAQSGCSGRSLEPAGLAAAGHRADRRVGREDGPAAGRAGVGRDARSGRPADLAADARVLPVAEDSAGVDFHARRADPLRPRTGDRLPPQPGENPQDYCGDFGSGTVAKGRLKVYNDGRIISGIKVTLQAGLSWRRSPFACRFTCLPKGQARPRRPSLNGASLKGTVFSAGRFWPRSTAPSRYSTSRPPAPGW